MSRSIKQLSNGTGVNRKLNGPVRCQCQKQSRFRWFECSEHQWNRIYCYYFARTYLDENPPAMHAASKEGQIQEWTRTRAQGLKCSQSDLEGHEIMDLCICMHSPNETSLLDTSCKRAGVWRRHNPSFRQFCAGGSRWRAIATTGIKRVDACLAPLAPGLYRVRVLRCRTRMV